MEKKQKRIGVPGILLTAGSALCLPFWLVALFFAFFLGGSPGPGYERTVPEFYVAIIGLGFLGAGLGLATGIRALCSAAVPVALTVLAAVFGAAGSVPFFLLELPAVGIVVLAVGIASPAVYLLSTRLTGRAKRN